MTRAAKTASVRPVPTAPDDARLKLHAFAAPEAVCGSNGARRDNWELRSLGAPGFALASARG
jgi:hypothetical protein